MIIRTMELLFEYMAIVLCIHKVAKKKVKINLWLFLPFFAECIFVVCNNMTAMPTLCRFVIFSGIFLYIRVKVVDSWKETINVCGIMMIIVMALQVLQYYILSFIVKEMFIIKFQGIIVNFNICILCLFWKEKYKNIIIVRLSKIKNAVIFFLILVIFLYLLIQNAYLDLGIAMKFLFETIGLSIACMLWISAEKEKSYKFREVQMYEMYNQAFEEAIITIRTRQHEFENHINAIKCMKYAVADSAELLLVQEQYCEKVLKENKINKLLKLDVEPVLIGFLYSKITSAEEKGINTEYEIQSIDIKEKIAIYEFVEIIGILFDNAVEALEKRESKKIILRLSREENTFSLEIANNSPFYLNSEIEKFCSYGYSTKGEKRGVGLSRVKDIVKKYNARYQIQNCIYYEENYLSFKIRFK